MQYITHRKEMSKKTHIHTDTQRERYVCTYNVYQARYQYIVAL